MNFLARIGGIILKVTEVVTGFAPILETALPGQKANIQVVSKDLAQIANIITEVEAIGQVLSIPGVDKLKSAAPLVAQTILQSSILVNHTINDSVLFKQGCTKIADGMADVLNSLHGNVDTTGKT